MTFAHLPISSVYRPNLRVVEADALVVAAAHEASQSICIFETVFSWSKRGEMHIWID